MVAGQVDGQHAEFVMGEVAGLQRPDAMVVLGTVDEDGSRQTGVEWLATRIGVGLLALDIQDHADSLGALPWLGLPTVSCGFAALALRPAGFCAAFSARLRSSIRSSGSSRPIDRRIVPSAMPAAASASASMRKCVVEAGWITSERASPTLARCENSESASMKRRPAA